MMTEVTRLATLERYGILDSPPEDAFDAIAREAAEALRCPFALVSFIDSQRQWYKASVGIGLSGVARTFSFCTHTIEGDDVVVIPDAQLDPRFARNVFVLGAPHVRFYAGAPIKALNRARLGTVCVFDTKPRDMVSTRDRRLLSALAARTMEMLEKRRWTMPTP
jgi:GAF domain-containing protein